MKNIVYIFLILSLLTVSCDEKKNLFSYKDVIDKNFKSDIGRPIALTIEQAIETEGDITKDGLYLYYSSDREKGNFDIYLRSLTDIRTIRLTRHSSKDFSPAVSPDGKTLLFVSNREDPEGDIYSTSIDPEEIFRIADLPLARPLTIDSTSKNLSSIRGRSKKIFSSIKDASPSWSPDGKKIVFSSNRRNAGNTRTGTTGNVSGTNPGTGSGTISTPLIENIWVMDSGGDNKKQITTKGGVHPKFSPDGKKIIFISYRDESLGDIYEVDTGTGEEKVLLKNNTIKFYPSYKTDSSEIIYTEIETDTNGDGKIDMNDNAVLIHRNLKDSTEYPLTLRSKSSFNSKWIPVFESPTVKGVIVYTDHTDANFNINLIPDTGIIPKRPDPRRQYNLAESYLNDYNDQESYILGLEMVFHYFGKSKDKISLVYAYKALADAFIHYNTKGDKHNKAEILNLAGKFYKQGNEFSMVVYEYLSALNSNKSAAAVLDNYSNKFKQDKDLNYYVPFILELAASDAHTDKNKTISYYNEIITRYKDYPRLNIINLKYNQLTYKFIEEDFSPIFMDVFKKGSASEKSRIIKQFIEITNTLAPGSRIIFSNKLKEKYKSDKDTMSLLFLVEGQALIDSDNIEEAKKILIEVFNHSNPTDILYYKNAILLGDIFLKEKNLPETEKYYYAAASKYRYLFREKNFRDKLKFLIEYYEESGERSENNGNFSEAAQMYEKYVSLMSYINTIRNLGDVYNKYASRAHVLYIDSYTTFYGEKSILQLEKKYRGKLTEARQNFDKALIYGLGYIYTRVGRLAERSDLPLEAGQPAGINGLIENFKKANEQVDWAQFIDGTFIDPYILKSWIYQYIDIKRTEDDGKHEKKISRVFPPYLLEKNIDILEKALSTNNENTNPENHGNLHLNLANSYFLLMNFPQALLNYKKSQKYKKTYGSLIEEAMLYYHLAYCYWQIGENEKARAELKNAIYIYDSLSAGSSKYGRQKFLLSKYLALFNRMEKKYSESIIWYEKLINIAENSKYPIDKSRYYQEIAYCYKETGEFEKALSYLDKSEKLLETYPDIDEKYYVQIKLFGFNPFPLYDLGQDTVVIGNNKIFTSLGTKDKKLYGLSLKEEIYSLMENYSMAVETLNKKIVILKKMKSKTALDSMTATLNNSGFYFYKLKNYKESKKQFSEAWDFATSPKVNDIEGAFTSIMNLVNLQATFIENNLQSRELSADDINKLIEKINSFRQNYENNKFKEDIKELKKNAEIRDKKVEEKDIADLKKKIKQDADNVYYKIDIALGVLYFYKAELFDDAYKVTSADEKDALTYIKKGTEIYSLYSKALSKFEKALDSAENYESKKLYIKLLLNTAACYNRIGTFNKAYELYIDAKDNAEKYMYQDLLFSSYFSLAVFLTESGSIVEGKDSLMYASEYFQKASNIAESSPIYFSENIKSIEKMFDKYAALLISMGDVLRAFSISERKYTYTRLVSIYSNETVFNNSDDIAAYKTFILKNNEDESFRNKISKLLESGSAPESKEITTLNEKIKDNNLSVKNLVKSISEKKPLFSDFIQISSPDLNEYKETVIKFHLTGHNLSAWKINNGKVQYKFISSITDKKISDKISSFIGLEDKKIFIIADPAFISVRKYISAEMTYFITPSFARVKNLLTTITASLKKIFTTSKLIKENFTSAGYIAEYVDNWEIDLANSSILLDTADNPLKPSILFAKTGAAYKLLAKKTDLSNADDLMLIFESALYSGIKNILFISYEKDEDTANMLFDINTTGSIDLTKTKKSLALSGPVNIKKVQPVPSEEREKSSVLILKNTVFAFRSGNFEQAKNLADKVASIEEKINNNSEEAKKAILIKSLLRLTDGDIAGAEEIISKSGLNFSDFKEKALIDAVVLLKNNEYEESLKKIEDAVKITNGIRGINITIIYRSYLKLAGLNDLNQDLILKLSGKNRPSYYENIIFYLLNDGIKSTDEMKPNKYKNSWLFISLIDNKKIFADKSKSIISDYDQIIDKAIKNSEKSDFSILKARLNLEKAARLKKQNLPYKLYDAYIQAEKNLSRENIQWKSLQLTITELEASLDKGSSAQQRIMKLLNQSDITEEEKTASLLIKSKVELLRFSKLKNPSENDKLLLEKIFSESINYFILNTENISAFKMKELLFDVIDAFINYKMRTENYADAVMYSDFKKHVTARAYLKKVPEIPSDILSGKNDSQALLLSDEYPQILITRLFKEIPIETIQKKLSADSVIIYNIKNGKNIFSWVIGNNFITALIIDNGYEKLKPVLDSYEEKISSFKNTYAESKAINEIFSPLETHYKKKKTIYFITDNDLEKVPYEIMGSKVFLDESHKIYYISSLLSALNPVKKPGGKINLISGDCSELFCNLEKTAISESRFKVSSDGNICHIMSKIIYNPVDMSMSISGINFFNLTKSSDFIYSSSDSLKNIGYSNFSIFASAGGAASVVISDPKVRDINSALFADSFYKKLSEGENVIASFEKAKLYLKSRKEFRHPAYWAAIRLYLNGL